MIFGVADDDDESKRAKKFLIASFLRSYSSTLAAVDFGRVRIAGTGAPVDHPYDAWAGVPKLFVIAAPLIFPRSVAALHSDEFSG